MTCSPSGRTIICQEVFDEDSKPSEQEILDYAVKIGIDPETEKHLLQIAQDGLMCALPEGWKPCFDEESKRWYYFNFKTGVTRWDHPLDDVFKELVKKSRSEGYSSAGDEDSKASGVELKTSEEIFNSKDSALSLQHNNDSLFLNSASGDNMQHITPGKLSPLRANKVISLDHRMQNLGGIDGAKETRLQDRRGIHKTSSNPLSSRPPLPPKRGSGSSGAHLLTSPMRSVSLDFSDSGAVASNQKLRDSRTASSLAEQHHGSRYSSPNRDVMQSSRSSPSPTRIDIDTMGVLSCSVTTPTIVQDKVQPPKPSVKGLTLTGRGSMFLKSKQKQGGLLQNADSQQSTPVYNSKFNLIKEAELLESPSYEQKKLLDSPSSEQKNIPELLFENKKIDSDFDELDTPRGEGTLQLRDQELSRELREDRKKSVRFADFEKKPLDIRFQVPDSDETTSMESENQQDDIDNWMSDEENLEDKIISQAKLESNNFKSLESVNHRDTSLEQALEKRIKSSSNAAKDNRRFVICETSDDTDLAMYSIRKVDNDLVNRLTQIKDYGQDVSTTDDLIVKGGERTAETKMLVSPEAVDNKNSITGAADEQSHNTNTKSKNAQNHVLITSNGNKEDHVTIYAKNDNDLRSPEWDSEHNKIVKDTNKPKFYNEAAAGDMNRIKTSAENNVETLYINSNNKKLTAEMNRNDNNIQNTNKSGAKLKQHMSKVDINKVFESVHEILINSAEHSDMDDDVMNTMMSSTNLDMEENDGNVEVVMPETKPVPESHIDEAILEDSRQTLRHILEEKLQAAKKELDEEFILKKQQLEETVEKSISELALRLEEEKLKKESVVMISHKQYLEDLENKLLKEREVKFKELREQHETFIQEQEDKISKERKRIEEETNQTIQESVTKLAKFVEESKLKEEQEITRMQKESQDRIKEIKTKIETEEAEYEEKHKQELAIVKSEFEKMLIERQAELKAAQSEKALLLEDELKVVTAQHEALMKKTMEQQQAKLEQYRTQCQQEEEAIKKQHAERMEVLTAQLNKQAGEKVDLTQLNREFEKVRCEKRLIEDKYRMLKEKYVRLKSEVRLSMERKRQAKLNRQLQLKQQRDTTSTTEDTTERSTDVTKNSDLSSRDQSKQTNSITLEHEQKPTTHKREERKSLPVDKSLAGPLENLRKQLEKLEELEEQFPPSTHTDTYLRYPFTDPATASSELEFYRHRLHLERESVQRARQALAEQKHMLDARQLQFRHNKPQNSIHQLYQEERELTDMEISLHRTRALLGEKIIRLRYLEQSLERADPQTTHHSPSNTLSEPLGATDSSGFSGSDLDLSSSGHVVGGGGGGVGAGLRSDRFWTDASFNVLQSLENINSEIREIWAILGKQQIPGTSKCLGPPPLLHYSELNRPVLTNANATQLDIAHRYNSMAPRRATDIAEKTRGLKEWLMRAKDQHSHHGT